MSMSTTITIAKHTSLLAIAVLLLFTIPNATSFSFQRKQTKVVVTNAHWSYLSIRCFSFDNSLGIQHLKPWQQFIFTVNPRAMYPSATIYNCSTNMGTLVAYKHDYDCAQDDVNHCQWRFDLYRTYHYSPSQDKWEVLDYNPNYESLALGGVVEGRYIN